MTEAERQILQNLVDRGGIGPDGPVLQRPEAAGMMRRGWIEAVKPKVPYIPYVYITDAGRAALVQN